MKIIKTYNWNRRDFYYDAECEFCGYIDKNNSGYDNDYYRSTVIPDKKCPKCGKKGIEYSDLITTNTKYDSNLIM